MKYKALGKLAALPRQEDSVHCCKEEDPNSHDGKKTPFEHLISAFLTEAEITSGSGRYISADPHIIPQNFANNFKFN